LPILELQLTVLSQGSKLVGVRTCFEPHLGLTLEDGNVKYYCGLVTLSAGVSVALLVLPQAADAASYRNSMGSPIAGARA
jgi:hypothetical protein